MRLQNDNKYITTLEIAEMLGIDHWRVLRKLDGIKSKKGHRTKGHVEILNDNKFIVTDYFRKSSYIDKKGETRPCYLVTRLGCDFLANMFVGERGVLLTAKCVNKFKDIEEILLSYNNFKFDMVQHNE